MKLLKNLNKNQKKGIIFGSLSPILYSIDSVLDILLFAIVFSVGYRNNLSLWQTITYSFITSFIKDLSLFIVMQIKTKGKVINNFIKLNKTKKRAFWWTVFGSLSGGPLGFSLTTATILYSGAAYGSALANFSPIIVLIFTIYFFKNKINKKGWLGVALAMIGFLGLSFYSSATKGGEFNFNIRVFIGLVLAIMAVLTWSIETIIAEYVEKFGNDKSLSDDEKLSIKSTVSSSSILIFFIPISITFSYIAGDWNNVSDMLQKLLSSSSAWMILFSIGIIIAFGRMSYWYAISHAGGGRADILYYLTVLFTPILVIILTITNVPGFKQPEGVNEWPYWVLLFVQIIGVILVTFNTNNNKEHIFKNKNIKL